MADATSASASLPPDRNRGVISLLPMLINSEYAILPG